ncbi:Stp1/IreP family PP2C-type Ser/Thr phosphatase [bacterium]|nr:Stp1/IreP family PP2C-type Ser/Thr phosphatase [candidate division CSSED10-310 bacterium]
MLNVAAITDVGLKRSVNQDAYHCDPKRKLFVVADGMGGHKAGETASRMAIEAVVNYLQHLEVDEKTPTEVELDELQQLSEALKVAIETANLAIYQKAQESSEFRGMGTTVVACLIIDESLIVAHVGDSRLYRLRNGELSQMTKDHSRVQELIDMEKLTEEQARLYPLRNVITRALGGDRTVDVDVDTFDFKSTDAWLLCSDGLSEVISEQVIKSVVLQNAGDPTTACRVMVGLTKEAGAPDNMTVIVVEGGDFKTEIDQNAPLSSFTLYPDAAPHVEEPPRKGFFAALFKKLKP